MAVLCCVFFFFFKQKTAYEILTCDWSSDVCSSDLNCIVGMLTTAPQCNFPLGFPENTQSESYILSLTVSGISKIMHCGILINMPYLSRVPDPSPGPSQILVSRKPLDTFKFLIGSAADAFTIVWFTLV